LVNPTHIQVVAVTASKPAGVVPAGGAVSSTAGAAVGSAGCSVGGTAVGSTVAVLPPPEQAASSSAKINIVIRTFFFIFSFYLRSAAISSLPTNPPTLANEQAKK